MNKYFMKRSYSVWLLALLFAGASLPFLNVLAQEAEAPAESVDKAESDTNSVTPTDAASNAPFRRRGPIVVWGRDVELKKGEQAETVVVIGGSARVHGKVDGAVVAIFGNVEITSEVREAAVAVLGNVKLGESARIRDAAVAVLGDIDADKGATVRDGAVAVGGRVEAAEGANMGGAVQSLDVPKPIKSWLIQCVLKLRPLAPKVGWVWLIAGMFFLLYFLLTGLFPRPVQACVAELTNRPATTFFLGLLTKMLVPVVFSILALTVAGVFVVPFLVAALFLGGLVGKAALLQSVGLRFARLLPSPTLQKPLLALLIGGLFITLLYNIPVIGLLTFMVVSIWGLGGAVTAAFAGLRREMPQRPPPTRQFQGVPPMPANQTGTGIPGQAEQQQVNPVPLPEALSFPRARLLERLAAGFLDIVLLSILCKICHVHGFWPFVALAYFAVMWTWKSTTVGGIILGLKVVRVDGQPMPFTVALVRALGAAFSVVVLFLGFLWIAWDREKQGWHDQIAGTVVIRMPRGTPLVCF